MDRSSVAGQESETSTEEDEDMGERRRTAGRWPPRPFMGTWTPAWTAAQWLDRVTRRFTRTS
jgi:hypothetical protein